MMGKKNKILENKFSALEGSALGGYLEAVFYFISSH